MAFAALAGLSACLGRSPQSTFYTLSPGLRDDRPGERPPGPRAEPSRPTLVIGPVTLPAYLDRAQIVTRPAPNTLHLDEFQRWAGPLAEDMASALREVIADELGPRARVVAYPAPSSLAPSQRVTVQVRRFDGKRAGRVVLEASWIVERVDQPAASVTMRETRLSAPSTGNDYPSFVKALSGLLAALGREIAAVLASGYAMM